jgi:hypothetical protein
MDIQMPEVASATYPLSSAATRTNFSKPKIIKLIISVSSLYKN